MGNAGVVVLDGIPLRQQLISASPESPSALPWGMLEINALYQVHQQACQLCGYRNVLSIVDSLHALITPLYQQSQHCWAAFTWQHMRDRGQLASCAQVKKKARNLLAIRFMDCMVLIFSRLS